MIVETIRVSMPLWTWVAGWVVAFGGGVVVTLAVGGR